LPAGGASSGDGERRRSRGRAPACVRRVRGSEGAVCAWPWGAGSGPGIEEVESASRAGPCPKTCRCVSDPRTELFVILFFFPISVGTYPRRIRRRVEKLASQLALDAHLPVCLVHCLRHRNLILDASQHQRYAFGERLNLDSHTLLDTVLSTCHIIFTPHLRRSI
jgi:hypothetical protein